MTPYNPSERDKQLLKLKADEHRTLALFTDLITSNQFSPHEILMLMKYVLDRYPHPINNLPLTYLRILQNEIPEPEDR